MATKRALVMSGGGAKGAFELGAAYGLIRDLHLDFDVIAGVSAGALHAAVLAQGRGYDGLVAQVEHLWGIWKHIRSSDDFFHPQVFDNEVASFAASLVWTKSVYDPTPVRERLAVEVDDGRLRDSGREFRIGVVSLETGEPRAIDPNADDIASWTLASGSIPWFFPPVTREAESYVDGGVRNITPFQDAFRALKKISAPSDDLEMYFVLASPLKKMPPVASTKLQNGREIGLRAVAILENQVFREDVLLALDVSDSVRAWVDLRSALTPPYPPALDEFPFRPPKYRNVDMLGIVPDKWYMDTLDFDRCKIREAFVDGREKARLRQFYQGSALRTALRDP